MAKRLALVVGNSAYDDPTLTQLKTPRADASALAEALRDPNVGGFDEVREFIDPTESRTRRAIGDFFARRQPRDLLVFYFSGHGVKDDRGRLYLALKDTTYRNLSATAVPSQYVVEQMDDCRSKRQVLILDCCNSGAFTRGMKGDPTAYTADTFAGTGFGRVVLTASDSTQYALEGDQVIERAELSLFTHYLLDGLLEGRAAPDQPWITLDALYDYAYGQVVSHASGQTPRKWVFNQEGSLVLARNPRHGGPAEPFPEPRPVVDALATNAGTTGQAGFAGEARTTQQASAADKSLRRLNDWAEGQPPALVWLVATLMAFSLAGLVMGSTRMALIGVVPKLIAGLVEGGLLGLTQAYALGRIGRDVSPKQWTQWTLGAVVIRWQIPLPGFPFAGFMATTLKGGLDGALVGLAQSRAGRMDGDARAKWVLLNVGAWTVAYWLFQPIIRALGSSLATAPGFSAVVIGSVTGVCVGGITALGLGQIQSESRGE